MLDDHGHPFADHGGRWEPAGISLYTDEGPDAERRRAAAAGRRLPAHLLLRRLARLLGCSEGDVPDARAEASGDWAAYVRRLLDDAGLDELILDVGAERDGRVAGRYAALTGRPVHWLGRIDPVVDRALADGADAAAVVEEVEAYCRQAAGAGCVGFKTAMAYRTGLAVDPAATLEQAQRSLDPALPVRRRGKACRDLVLRRVLGVAAELGLPLQVHTGFGDSTLRLSESNPLLLEEVLRSAEGRAAAVVLIHGAYPFTEELGYLAMSRPNVWAEVSLLNIFAPLQAADRIVQLLELAPTDRILFGTDGHEQPETFWFAAHVLREAWEQAADRLTGAGAGAGWLAAAHDAVTAGTARELYGV